MNSNMFLKLCAVSNSLLLVVAFVSYRAGAFGWLTESTDARPELIDVDESHPVIQLVPVNTSSGEHVLSSSKSGAVFIDPESASPDTVRPALESTVDTSILIGGSKSLQMLPPTAPTENVVVDGESAGP